MNTTQEIINLIKQQDEKGLRLLYKHYSDALFGIAFRVLQHEAFAEDALQKSYLKIWNSIHQYDADKSILFTWMSNIVRNTAIDIKRLKSFEKESKTDTIDANVYKSGSTETENSKLDVDYLLTKVEEKYAIVLDHLYLKGYSQSELAEKLDLPLGTIKTRVKKAIDLLRDHLSNEKSLFAGFFVCLVFFIIIISVRWI